ncbi:MAG: hypothetical protein Q4D88_06550 [Anaerococcus sp.]|nr:hypothetical protein [Anaerococcus sp.]
MKKTYIKKLSLGILTTSLTLSLAYPTSAKATSEKELDKLIDQADGLLEWNEEEVLVTKPEQKAPEALEEEIEQKDQAEEKAEEKIEEEKIPAPLEMKEEESTNQEEISKEAIVTFSANGGYYPTYGEILKIDLNTNEPINIDNPIREGYSFIGYTKEKIGMELDPHALDNLKAGDVLYALWEEDGADNKDKEEENQEPVTSYPSVDEVNKNNKNIAISNIDPNADTIIISLDKGLDLELTKKDETWILNADRADLALIDGKLVISLDEDLISQIDGNEVYLRVFNSKADDEGISVSFTIKIKEEIKVLPNQRPQGRVVKVKRLVKKPKGEVITGVEGLSFILIPLSLAGLGLHISKKNK